jgi:hypothetical protein
LLRGEYAKSTTGFSLEVATNEVIKFSTVASGTLDGGAASALGFVSELRSNARPMFCGNGGRLMT